MTTSEVWLPSDAEIAAMTPEEQHEVTELLYALRAQEDEEYLPQPKQALATNLATRAVETLYGGAAGGGKSHWLLHYVLDQMLEHPFNRGVIFRRFFPSLERTLIDRSKQIYPKYGGRYNEVKHTWRFPNGSVLEMGSLPTAADVTNYQGTEYGVIAFEEITEFEEKMVDAMVVRLRPPGPGIRSHLIATCNPGGRGHRWVKRRWVKPKPDDYPGSAAPLPYEVWTPVSKPENPEPNSRVFVPATLEDNPILEQRDPTYRNKIRALANSDKALALAMEHGDWDAIDAVEGALWKQSDLDGGRVSKEWFRLNVTVQRRVLAVDPSDGNEDGKGDEYGVAVVSLGMDGIGYVELTQGWRASPDMMAKKTVQLAAEMGCDYIVVEKNHGGKWVKTTIQSKDRYAVIKTVWASEGKVTRARPVAGLFAYDEDLVDLGLQYRIRMVGTAHEKFEEQACLAPGTTVATEHGPLPIESVLAGMSVWTRKGLRRVLWSGQTAPVAATLTLVTGQGSITCTPEHPVYVQDHGFVPCKDVPLQAMLLVCPPENALTAEQNYVGRKLFAVGPAPSGSAGEPLMTREESGLRQSSQVACTTCKTVGITCRRDGRGIPAERCCTETSGKLSEGLYRMAGMFTTSTTSRRITALRIWLLSARKTITIGIRRRSASFLHRPPKSVESAQNECGAAENRDSLPAKSAIPRTKQRVCDPRTTAPVDAATEQWAAVERIEPGPSVPVYNLMVDGEPEFFANGLLVHNCTFTGAPGEVSPNEMDAVVWAATELLLQPQVSRDSDQYKDERLANRR